MELNGQIPFSYVLNQIVAFLDKGNHVSFLFCLLTSLEILVSLSAQSVPKLILSVFHLYTS